LDYLYFSSLILPKPVKATYITCRHELGVNPEQPNRKQLLELVNQLIAQSESAAQCPSSYPSFELHPAPVFPNLAFTQQ
jgi:hypothetical protein